MRDLSNKIAAFNKRWNIIPKNDEAIVFLQFKTRILNDFERIELYVKSAFVFCQALGIHHQPKSRNNIYNVLTRTTNIVDLFRALEIIFVLEFDSKARREFYLNQLLNTFEISNVGARVIDAQGEVLIVPAGEEKLDNELVDHVLSFLPNTSNDHFVSALQSYEQKLWIKCAESTRRTLEEYLRVKLNNNCGLTQNISNIGKALKNTQSPAQIRNVVSATFSHLDQFFNENSKHHDGDLEESDAEFIIYQTALLMRYIEKYV
jgi:hypothetical protein